MGCDIHLKVEIKNDRGAWEVLPAPANGGGFGANEGEGPSYRYPPGDWIDRIEGPWEISLEGEDDEGNPVERRSLRDWWDTRNYVLFACLSNVRNGASRFGGEPGPIIPLTPVEQYDNNLPDDVSPEVAEDYERWDCDAHSAGAYTLKELQFGDWTGDRNGGGSGPVEALANRGHCFFHKDMSPEVREEYYSSLSDVPSFLEELAANAPDGDPTRIRIVFWYDN